jgi:acyl-CoA thioester hydrolase
MTMTEQAQAPTPSSQPFRYYLRVRYGECDAQKVVFNARYGDYVDLSTSEFFRACFGEVLASGEVDFQLVKQTFEWKAPARFDQVLEISVFAQRLGHTSFTLASIMRIAGDERVIATAETVYVLVEPHKLVKMTIPDSMRAAMEKGAPGAIIDHAGYINAQR